MAPGESVIIPAAPASEAPVIAPIAPVPEAEGEEGGPDVLEDPNGDQRIEIPEVAHVELVIAPDAPAIRIIEREEVLPDVSEDRQGAPADAVALIELAAREEMEEGRPNAFEHQPVDQRIEISEDTAVPAGLAIAPAAPAIRIMEREEHVIAPDIPASEEPVIAPAAPALREEDRQGAPAGTVALEELAAREEMEAAPPNGLGDRHGDPHTEIPMAVPVGAVALGEPAPGTERAEGEPNAFGNLAMNIFRNAFFAANPVVPPPGTEMAEALLGALGHPQGDPWDPLRNILRQMWATNDSLQASSNELLAMLRAAGVPVAEVPVIPRFPNFFNAVPRRDLMLPPESDSWTEEERALFIALVLGDWETARFYVEAGVNLNLIVDSRHQKSLLIWLAERVPVNLIHEIILIFASNPEFDPNMCDDRGDTAAHVCVRRNDIESINVLLDLPNSNVNAQGQFGLTILHLIVIRALPLPDFGLWEDTIWRLLRDPRLDLEIPDYTGVTVDGLLLALQEHSLAPAWRNLAHFESNPETDAIIERNIPTLLQQIAETKARRLETNLEAELRDIIMNGNVERLLEWIADHPNFDPNWQDPTSGNRTLLMYAAATGDIEIFRIIAALPGIDPQLVEWEGKDALSFAEANWNEEIIGIIRSMLDRLPEDLPAMPVRIQRDLPAEEAQ
jgi:hypothetical protein